MHSTVGHKLFARFLPNVNISSPDSGMPSTPSMGVPYEGESPTALYRDKVKFEVTEKVTGLYQEHIKSLKASLDTIWVSSRLSEFTYYLYLSLLFLRNMMFHNDRHFLP